MDVCARDIMTTAVKAIGSDAMLAEVVEFFVENEIGGAPVVDENRLLVGMISKADLVNENKRRAVISPMGLFGLWTLPDELLREAFREGMYISVLDLMSRNVITAGEDTPLKELAQMMLSNDINRIPILRESELVGIVTREDVLRGLLDS